MLPNAQFIPLYAHVYTLLELIGNRFIDLGTFQTVAAKGRDHEIVSRESPLNSAEGRTMEIQIEYCVVMVLKV